MLEPTSPSTQQALNVLLARLLDDGAERVPYSSGPVAGVVRRRRLGMMSYCGLVAGDGIGDDQVGPIVDGFFNNLQDWHRASSHSTGTGFGYVKGSWATLVFVFDGIPAHMEQRVRREKRTAKDLPRGLSLTTGICQVACWVIDCSQGRVVGSCFPPFTTGRYPGRRRLEGWLRDAAPSPS
jgi:hypothetical protein